MLTTNDINQMIIEVQNKQPRSTKGPIKPKPPYYKKIQLYPFITKQGFIEPPKHQLKKIDLDVYQSNFIKEQLYKIALLPNPSQLLVFECSKLSKYHSNRELKLFLNLQSNQAYIKSKRKHINMYIIRDIKTIQLGCKLDNLTTFHDSTFAGLSYNLLKQRVTPILTIKLPLQDDQNLSLILKQNIKTGSKAQSRGKASLQYITDTFKSTLFIKKLHSNFQNNITPLPATVYGIKLSQKRQSWGVSICIMIDKYLKKHIAKLGFYNKHINLELRQFYIQSQFRCKYSFGTLKDKRLLPSLYYLKGKSSKVQPLAIDYTSKIKLPILNGIRLFLMGRMSYDRIGMIGWGMNYAGLEWWMLHGKRNWQWGMKFDN